MDKIMEVIDRMYTAPEYSVKGKSQNFKDAFLYQYMQSSYVVFVMEQSNLSMEKIEYKYALYSCENDNVVGQNSTLYKEIVALFPSLDDVICIDAIPDVIKRRQLRAKYNLICEKYIGNGGNLKEISSEYLLYLEDEKKLKSDSFKKIYDYFINYTMEASK